MICKIIQKFFSQYFGINDNANRSDQEISLFVHFRNFFDIFKVWLIQSRFLATFQNRNCNCTPSGSRAIVSHEDFAKTAPSAIFEMGSHQREDSFLDMLWIHNGKFGKNHQFWDVFRKKSIFEKKFMILRHKIINEWVI